jgi:hypothetical protein
MCRIMTELPIEIRRSRRARRLSARVHLDGHVEVVVPMYAPGVIVDDFVARHRTFRARLDPTVLSSPIAICNCTLVNRRAARNRERC